MGDPGVSVSERGSPCDTVFQKVLSAVPLLQGLSRLVSGSPEQKTPEGPDITPSASLLSSSGVGLLRTQPSPVWLGALLANL